MPALTDQLLSRLSNHLAAQMGWHFPPDRWRELESGMEMAARELGIADVTAYAHELLTTKLSQRQIEALVSAFTIGETYFFRDSRSCEVLAQSVLPELIRARRADRRLRIWSAGCCTGEEAYTLAILLDRLLPDLEAWQITLLATDINSRFLHKAVAARYGEWSFRGAPPWLKERYFRRIDERKFELLPRIRSLVTFANLNLVEDPFPSLTSNTNAMDLILCRNVLMYFSAERVAMVVDKFHRSLLANGLFLVSAVETSLQIATRFVLTPRDGVSFYRKQSDDELALTNRVPAQVSEPAPFTASPTASLDAPTTIRPAARVPTPVVQSRVREPMTPPTAHEPAELVTQAVVLFEHGRYADARNLLLAGGEAAPNSEKATLLARIYANLGDLPAALTWAERAVLADRTNAQSHYLRAVILQESNQLEDAAIALQRTLYLEPQFVLAHFALGNLELHWDRQASAARHFNNALALLRRCDDNEVLPHSDGMAAGRLQDMIRSVLPANAA